MASVERIQDYEVATHLTVVEQPAFKAVEAVAIVDSIITDIYLPFRGQRGYGTERAILIEPPHVPHRENDAEHSWHVAMTCMALYENRQALDMPFPKGFSLAKMFKFSVVHDIEELVAPDVDAMTTDQTLVDGKLANSIAASEEIRRTMPYMSGVMDAWEEYEPKDVYEAMYVSDVDKIVGTRMICLDGGKRWHRWGDSGTSMQRMIDTNRAKMLTAAGHQMTDVIEADLAVNPHYFPEFEHPQGKLFF